MLTPSVIGLKITQCKVGIIPLISAGNMIKYQVIEPNFAELELYTVSLQIRSSTLVS